MAINPNTDFSSGSVLTADQQNRFPRGIVAYTESTTSNTSITTEAVQLTGSSFTAVANRYYRITYFEPNCYNGTGYFTFRIRKTNLTGTLIQETFQTCGTSVDRQAICVGITTFSAGTVNVVATAAQSAGTGALSASTGRVRFLMVEDIGPA